MLLPAPPQRPSCLTPVTTAAVAMGRGRGLAASVTERNRDLWREAHNAIYSGGGGGGGSARPRERPRGPIVASAADEAERLRSPLQGEAVGALPRRPLFRRKTFL